MDANIKDCIAIVENGDTASVNIAQGQYVIWKSHAYKALSNIATGDTLSSTNLSALTAGTANDLNSQITSINGNLTSLTNSTIHFVKETANNVTSISVNTSSFGNSDYPRLFLVKSALWNAQSIDCAIGFYKQSYAGASCAFILTKGGNTEESKISSASYDVNTNTLTVTFTASRSYIELLAFDN